MLNQAYTEIFTNEKIETTKCYAKPLANYYPPLGRCNYTTKKH